MEDLRKGKEPMFIMRQELPRKEDISYYCHAKPPEVHLATFTNNSFLFFSSFFNNLIEQLMILAVQLPSL